MNELFAMSDHKRAWLDTYNAALEGAAYELASYTPEHRDEMRLEIIAEARAVADATHGAIWREGPPITQRGTPDGIEVRVPVEVKLTTPMYSARIYGPKP
jgi:hypothetical protein